MAALANAQRKPLLTNMQRVLGPQIAEHSLALMFSLTRGLHRYAGQQRERQWRRGSMDTMWEVAGKTMLVVGLGGIGSEIAMLQAIFLQLFHGFSGDRESKAQVRRLQFSPRRLNDGHCALPLFGSQLYGNKGSESGEVVVHTQNIPE